MNIVYLAFFSEFIFTGNVCGDERSGWRHEGREQGGTANRVDRAITRLIGAFSRR